MKAPVVGSLSLSSSSLLSWSSVICSSSLLLGVIALGGCSGSSKPTIMAVKDVDDDLPAQPVPGPAPTPPMGWNSWNAFKSSITENLIKQMADAMVASGMKDAGYQYVNIDDTWSTKDPTLMRAADEPLVADVLKFPSGMPALADYVHGQGLKLGIYADRGTLTCGSYPGSAGHEQQDATTFAGWGIDYVKYDNCPPDPLPTSELIRPAYTAMGAALAASGRSMVYSLCAWNFYEWGIALGSLWRTTSDITTVWDSGNGSIIANIKSNVSFAAYAGPNGWNDPDMLEVGNVALPDEETAIDLTQYRSHFTLWAISAAPLITGNDLRHMSAAVTSILTNKEVIALDQDALGYQGVPVRPSGDVSLWAKPLNESGARGVVLFNESDAPVDMTVSWAEIGLRSGGATVRDLWAHADLGAFNDTFTATAVPAHDVVALRIVGVEPPRPASGVVSLSDLSAIYAANGLGLVAKDATNGGGPLKLRGTISAKGLGVASPSSVVYRLARACTSFTANVGIDDQSGGLGSVDFQVWADGAKLFDSGVVTGATPVMPVQVDVTGKHRLKLVVTNGGDNADRDYADWADAQLNCL